MNCQIKICALRLESAGFSRLAEEFEGDLVRAARLHAQATELRRRAWAEYREALGIPKKTTKRRKL
jgi:hypothetical protein